MEPTIDAYPQFVANQVLKKDHLNELFGYLDEQNRLTRTNLIGIGIVCGLDIIPDAAASKITVTKGCGVTSAGYLVAVDTVELTRYQDYVVPAEILYPPFYDSATKKNKYTFWEMLPAGGSHALDATFWADKVVLIFVELKAENLKNCSPNSCDDRGSEVTVTFRYLLISLTDADLLRAELLGASGNQTTTDLDQLQHAKALLKEIKLKRFDVPRQLPLIYSADELFATYQKILDQTTIDTLKTQLLQAYTIYQPLLGTLPDTALQNFGSAFNYVSGQLTLTNPLEYQYYYDFISDLIEAYNEIRATGLYAIGICCPNENLFPRHLMLGKAIENTMQVTSNYRNYFIPSPLFGHHKEIAGQIQQLFGRIVRMIEEFSIPAPKSMSDFNAVRITPSYLGRELLSQKALPFYYQITDGTPPLYELWNYEKTREDKAKTNLSYHANLYPTPVDNFVLQPLEYDLEPYNFFRIEGHVGLHWFYALIRLVNLRVTNRLPFDIVVLKTGKNYSNILDWHTHQCYFQDLETLFASLKEELLCLLCQEARYFYDVPLFKRDTDQRFSTKVDFLRHCDPIFTYRENTWGFLYETAFEKVDFFKLFTKWQKLAADQQVKDFLLLIHKIIELGDLLKNTENLVQLNFELYRAKHQDLKEYTAVRMAALRDLLPQESSDQLATAWLLEDLIDHLDFIIHACKIESFESLVETCRKRREAIQQQLIFGNYIKKNPGINHKAGVPVGGTFLLVYAGEEQDPKPPQTGRFVIAGSVLDVSGAPLPGVSIMVKNSTQGTTTDASGRFLLMVNQLPVSLVIAFVGVPTREVEIDEPTDTLQITLGEAPATNGNFQLPNGIVIADFYLPYICCSDCLPIQLNIPEPKTEEPSELQVAVGDPVCDEERKNFTVVLTISGGTPPYTVKEQPVNGPDGKTHTITLPTNQGDAFIVADNANQKKTITISAHNCQPGPEPCDLPCEGKAEKCLYPLWVPKPSKERKINTPEINETILIITDQENNKQFTVEFSQVYKSNLSELDKESFDERFKRFTEELTGLIAQQMGTGIFEVTYDEKTRLLSFEHYFCHVFNMQIDVRLFMLDTQFPVSAQYNQDGWTITDREFNKNAEGRKVGCILLDKCKNTAEPVCDRIIEPDKITIFADMPENVVNYNLLNEDGLQPGLWIFENGGPFISQEFSGEYRGVVSLEDDSVWFLGLMDDCYGVTTKFMTND